jgi:hypothetical protein
MLNVSLAARDPNRSFTGFDITAVRNALVLADVVGFRLAI